MNIFKILASGDGRINEPNVSAFLGYLLNPNEDHGLGDELLKKVIFNLYENANRNKIVSNLEEFILDKDKEIRNFSSKSNFEVKVLLEQAFKSKSEKKKEIVDLVILCYEKIIGNIESLAQAVISRKNSNELKHIFLIENKIKDESTTEDQLKNQYKASIDALEEILNANTVDEKKIDVRKMLSLIFISPNGEKSNIQFKKFQDEVEVSKTHIYWNNDDSNTIVGYLKEILNRETTGEIEAINDYAKHTIKSFVTFVENDFKSAIDEELEAESKKEIYDNFTDLKNKNSGQLNDTAWEIIEKFCKAIKENKKYENNINIRHSPTHPASVLIKDKDRKDGKKIFGLTRFNKDLGIHLIYRNHNILESEREKMKQFLIMNKLTFKDKENGVFEIKPPNLNIDLILDLFALQYDLASKNE